MKRLINMGNPHLVHILQKGKPHIILEKTAEVFFVKAKQSGAILKGYRFFKMFIDKGDDILKSLTGKRVGRG